MLVELNRFLTAEDIREEYAIPAPLFDKLLPVLPWHFEEDGVRVRYYLQSRVDAFLDRFAAGLETENGFDGRPVPAALPDGPFPPDGFRLCGREYTGLYGHQWQLLELVWRRDRVQFEDALEAVYGHDHEKKGAALYSLRKRLNVSLTEQGCTAQVLKREGYFVLAGLPGGRQ